MSEASPFPFRYLKLDEVKKLTALPASTLYAKAAQGRFPAPVKLGERSSGFRSDHIELWLRDPIGYGGEKPTAAVGTSANSEGRA
jgi:prophage regulatory protein